MTRLVEGRILMRLKIRNKIQANGIDVRIWNDVQVQIIEKGYTFEKGVIQDATFIDARVERKRYYKEKKCICLALLRTRAASLGRNSFT